MATRATWLTNLTHARTRANDLLGLCSCRRAGCDRPAKHPLTARGFKDATTNPELIRV
ncbi:MAG: hypothetical protein ACRDZ4_01345 [Egibacteraceae bacterium]